MKKFFVTMVFALILTAAPVFSQTICPPGYQVGVIDKAIGNCHTVVTFCWTCGLPWTYGIHVTNINVTMAGTTCTDNEWWWNEVLPHWLGEFLITKPGCIRPCSQTDVVEAVIEYSACSKWIHHAKVNPGDPDTYTIAPCEGQAVCRRWYKYCLNLGVPELYKEFVRKEFIGTADCPLDYLPYPPVVPPSVPDPNGYWETGCFSTNRCED